MDDHDLEKARKALRSTETQQKILNLIFVILLIGFVLIWLRYFR